jgi:hypothetical protein
MQEEWKMLTQPICWPMSFLGLNLKFHSFYMMKILQVTNLNSKILVCKIIFNISAYWVSFKILPRCF